MVENSIQVILFDLGNVILPFNHYQIGEKLSKLSNHKDFQNPDKIFSYIFDLEHGIVNPYEEGKISSSEFFKTIREDLRLLISFNEFQPIWNDIFWENKEVTELICSLEGKKRLCLVSNTNPMHFDYILSKFPIIKKFEKWILSYEVGYKKPSLKIYECALKWASIKPKHILFIDDIKKHIDVAISMGMNGILFKSAEQLKKELFKYHVI